MDWRIKYIIYGIAIICALLVMASTLTIYIPDPSQDFIRIWTYIANDISLLALCFIAVGFMEMIREIFYPYNDDSSSEETRIRYALITAALLVFEGTCILLIGIIPLILCINLIVDPIVPDLLKGIITIPFVAYLVYSIGSPAIFGSFFELVPCRCIND